MALTTNVTNMLTQRVVVSQPGVLQVFAQNEATLTPPMVDPPWPPFVCGALVETAASLLQVAGTGIATTQVIERRPFSESQGQTHVFLPNAIRDIAVGAGTFTLETGAAVDQGRNATVTTAGGNSSIDSVLAVVSGAIVERP